MFAKSPQGRRNIHEVRTCKTRDQQRRNVRRSRKLDVAFDGGESPWWKPFSQRAVNQTRFMVGAGNEVQAGCQRGGDAVDRHRLPFHLPPAKHVQPQAADKASIGSGGLDQHVLNRLAARTSQRQPWKTHLAAGTG